MFAAVLLTIGMSLPYQTPPPPRPMISGVVVDSTGLPIPGAVITVRGTTALAVSALDGRFSIEASTGSGTVLTIAMTGFGTRELTVPAGRTDVRVTLDLATMSTDVTVRAPAASAPAEAQLILRPLDVVRTAGAQADVMRAIGSLPGVARVDEGAGLFVRGGDVSETRVLLDGAVVNHPYRYETPTGGFRGAVDPFLTQGISFSTGGFSAEYANSLSGVLEMHGLDRPTAAHATGSAGLAGVAGSVAIPAGSRAGFRLAANRTTPTVLFGVNEPPTEFDQLPNGWDVSGSGHADFGRYGAVRLFAMQQRDGVGVKLEQDAFAGFLHSSTRHRLIQADWRAPLTGSWSATAALGIDRYTSGVDVGVLTIDTVDREHSLRVDVGGEVRSWTVRTGADLGRSSSAIIGRVPSRGGDFAGVTGISPFDVAHTDLRSGAYVETSRAFGRITPTMGARVDRYDQAGTWRVDPRVNLRIDVSRQSHLRLAWGRYHQAPSPRYFDTGRGVSALGPMEATHYIVGYEMGRMTDAWFFRAEAYRKTYRDLPVDNGAGGFSGDGYGYAHGLDLFARRVWHFIDVRASVSAVDARRRWTSPDQRDRYPIPDGTWTPDFAIPFSGQLNVTAPVWKTVSVSLSWRAAAGRPFTPVINAIPTPAGFEPVFGAINSERVPRYERYDFSVSHTRTLGGRGLAVFYASLDNFTGRANFFEYAYSSDYQQRHPVAGASPRSFYIGCTITR